MNSNQKVVNLDMPATIAPLTNVALCSRALEAAINRPAHLPGIVAFYGYSGIGKSVSAAYAANSHRAYYVEVKRTWTGKALLQNILKEMGIKPAKVMYNMSDQISEQLALSGRPLIIDEMDHIVARNYVEIVRDIYGSSEAPILIIGEENLENNLRSYERFHNRILDWVPAQPASLSDIQQLVSLYCSDVQIADDLLASIQTQCKGGIRRVCVNLERVRQFALTEGLDEVDLAAWGKRALFTGVAPVRGE